MKEEEGLVFFKHDKKMAFKNTTLAQLTGNLMEGAENKEALHKTCCIILAHKSNSQLHMKY